jgi:hypothetical protein
VASNIFRKQYLELYIRLESQNAHVSLLFKIDGDAFDVTADVNMSAAEFHDLLSDQPVIASGPMTITSKPLTAVQADE